MNLDQIEDMIRRCLSAGIAVVFVLVAPVTGTEADAPGTGTVQTGQAGNGEIDIIEVGPPGAAGEPDDTGSPGTGEDASTTDDPPDPDGPPFPGTGDDGSGDEAARDDAAAPSDGTGSEPDDTGASDDTDTGDGTGDGDGDGDGDDAGDDAGDDDDGRDGTDTAGDAAGSGSDGSTGDSSGYPGTTDTGTGDEDSRDPDPDAGSRDTAEDPGTTDAGTGTGTGTSGPADDSDLDARGPADADEPGISDGSAGADGTTGDGDTGDGAGDPAAGGEGTAAERYGWGTAVQADDFTSSRLTGWTVYRGTGHDGEGRRSADAIDVQDGVLTITGDEQGTTGGMCWGEGQRHGRWEARVRASVADPSYHALLLLWPDADDAPAGGEIDFMELQDPARRSAEFYLHFGEDGDQMRSRARVDATAWHDWAVEWTPEAIVGYLDGEEWFRSTDPDTFPPGPMHLCVQLDWFPEGTGQVRESRMEVDRVRQYALDDGGATVEPASARGSVLERMFSWG